MFDELEEWEQFTDSFARVKLKDVRLLYSNLSDLLPHIEYLDAKRQKERKRNLLASLPRRTSDRIATKAAEKEEIVSTVLTILWKSEVARHTKRTVVFTVHFQKFLCFCFVPSANFFLDGWFNDLIKNSFSMFHHSPFP